MSPDPPPRMGVWVWERDYVTAQIQEIGTFGKILASQSFSMLNELCSEQDKPCLQATPSFSVGCTIDHLDYVTYIVFNDLWLHAKKWEGLMCDVIRMMPGIEAR